MEDLLPTQQPHISFQPWPIYIIAQLATNRPMGQSKREGGWAVCRQGQEEGGERAAGFITAEEGDYSRKLGFLGIVGMEGEGGILLPGMREAGKEAQLPGRSGNNIILKAMGQELLRFLIIITH